MPLFQRSGAGVVVMERVLNGGCPIRIPGITTFYLLGNIFCSSRHLIHSWMLSLAWEIANYFTYGSRVDLQLLLDSFPRQIWLITLLEEAVCTLTAKGPFGNMINDILSRSIKIGQQASLQKIIQSGKPICSQSVFFS